jgi:hypothetical protein
MCSNDAAWPHFKPFVYGILLKLTLQIIGQNGIEGGGGAMFVCRKFRHPMLACNLSTDFQKKDFMQGCCTLRLHHIM